MSLSAEQIELHVDRMLAEAKRYLNVSTDPLQKEFWRGTVKTLESILWVIRHNQWSLGENLGDQIDTWEHTE